MGREPKFLLALLGLLSGALVGVVAIKLFVPRPPAGAGPDIHLGDVSATEVQDLVEPPPLALPSIGHEPTGPDRDGLAAPASRFAPGVPAIAPSAALPEAARPVRDPFVAPAAFTPPPPSGSADEPPARDAATGHPGHPGDELAAPEWNAGGDGVFPGQPASPPVESAGHVARPGDSWWSLAERNYGDGRLYRALFAWNRARDPRISLVPGTTLELPPLDRLRTAWPALMPRD
jgi:5'-nucleotidase/UDP-sugar diphosphatase